MQRLKSFQLQGGFAPTTPYPAALPLDPAGGLAPDPRSALAILYGIMYVHLQIFPQNSL